MKKVYLISLMLIFSVVFLGCNAVDDQTEDTKGDSTKETEEEKMTSENNENESDTKDIEQNESGIVLNTGSSETVNREIEGMDEEIKVVNYEIQPYNIAYQLDETFDSPEVKSNQITYSAQDDEYKITLFIMENTNLENAVSNLQEQFAPEEYEEIGELESTPLEENYLKGKMQSFAYPNIQGFYAYTFDEYVLAITYQYPVEAGDGMGPLLADLRKSIHVQ